MFNKEPAISGTPIFAIILIYDFSIRDRVNLRIYAICHDKAVYNFAENSRQSNLLAHTILLSEALCAHELDKAHLIIDNKDKEIAWLNKEVERLQEIIALLKQKDSSVEK